MRLQGVVVTTWGSRRPLRAFFSRPHLSAGKHLHPTCSHQAPSNTHLKITTSSILAPVCVGLELFKTPLKSPLVQGGTTAVTDRGIATRLESPLQKGERRRSDRGRFAFRGLS